MNSAVDKLFYIALLYKMYFTCTCTSAWLYQSAVDRELLLSDRKEVKFSFIEGFWVN